MSKIKYRPVNVSFDPCALEIAKILVEFEEQPLSAIIREALRDRFDVLEAEYNTEMDEIRRTLRTSRVVWSSVSPPPLPTEQQTRPGLVDWMRRIKWD
jgi:hypothetical protein